ncbi:HPP family protein [Sphingomonas endolithica]|uniref:HPP family protein n=1 Tax=Sphingomonas endolithica TaxID=2972485 RepID=UPI0021AF2A9D|nr:HPP family protein [Sphingomonas sp. ZFBP2030]
MKKLFSPILAGASLGDRLVACLGALLGIALTAFVSARLAGSGLALLIVAPMGASAVLVFAVPASPLAQPWPAIGGNILSALVGITVAHLVPIPALAAGLAVAGAILVMSLTRSLHPPGGATALLAVIGGPQVAAAGYTFALLPVGLNAVILALLGILIHRFTGHSYPHRAVLATATPRDEPAASLYPADLDQALVEMGESFDISREDLELLLQRAEHHAAGRRAGAR